MGRVAKSSNKFASCRGSGSAQLPTSTNKTKTHLLIELFVVTSRLLAMKNMNDRNAPQQNEGHLIVELTPSWFEGKLKHSVDSGQS